MPAMRETCSRLVLLLLKLSSIHTCLVFVPRPPPTTTSRPITTTTTTNKPGCRCGLSNPMKVGARIFEGNPVKKNEYPWLVALVKNGNKKPYCGGALISSNTVLTSAQCNYPLGFFKVHVQEHDVTNSDGEIKIEA